MSTDAERSAVIRYQAAHIEVRARSMHDDVLAAVDAHDPSTKPGLVHTGWWPGELEAVALNLWTRWGPSWVECNADHPEARPDLNRWSRWRVAVPKEVAASLREAVVRGT